MLQIHSKVIHNFKDYIPVIETIKYWLYSLCGAYLYNLFYACLYLLISYSYYLSQL